MFRLVRSREGYKKIWLERLERVGRNVGIYSRFVYNSFCKNNVFKFLEVVRGKYIRVEEFWSVNIYISVLFLNSYLILNKLCDYFGF